jgi:hypothetical protein
MRTFSALAMLGLGAVLLSAPALADDVTGVKKMICTTIQVTECFADGGCVSGQPENWNIPRFTRVDLTEMTLETTAASGESRTTPIERIEREGDDVFAQGAEGGKGFSFLLDEDTGTTSAAIVLEGSVLATFGVCTPTESSQ